MLNEACVRAIMLYLDKNLIPNSRGKIIGIHARNIYPMFEHSFDQKEFNYTVVYLVDNGFITKTNPSHKNRSADAGKINGITEKGYKYLDYVRDDTLWNKFQKQLSLENVLNAISLGKTVSEFFGKLPR